MARLFMMACFPGAPMHACSEHQISQSLHIDRELRRLRNTSLFLIWIDVGLLRAEIIAIMCAGWKIRSLARRADACMCDGPTGRLLSSALVASDPVVPKRINFWISRIATFLILSLFRSHSMFSASRAMLMWSFTRLFECVVFLAKACYGATKSEISRQHSARNANPILSSMAPSRFFALSSSNRRPVCNCAPWIPAE